MLSQSNECAGACEASRAPLVQLEELQLRQQERQREQAAEDQSRRERAARGARLRAACKVPRSGSRGRRRSAGRRAIADCPPQRSPPSAPRPPRDASAPGARRGFIPDQPKPRIIHERALHPRVPEVDRMARRRLPGERPGTRRRARENPSAAAGKRAPARPRCSAARASNCIRARKSASARYASSRSGSLPFRCASASSGRPPAVYGSHHGISPRRTRVISRKLKGQILADLIDDVMIRRHARRRRIDVAVLREKRGRDIHRREQLRPPERRCRKRPRRARDSRGGKGEFPGAS